LEQLADEAMAENRADKTQELNPETTILEKVKSKN
jgi:hypothetical protein